MGELVEPTRPQNAYWLWLAANREKLQAEVGSKKVGPVGKLGGEKWKAMTDAQRKPFEESAAKLKAQYDKDMEEYKAKGGVVGKRRADKKAAAASKPSKKAKKEAREASGKPKRPANPYWIWLAENRSDLAKEAGGAQPKAVGKLAGDKWSKMSDTAKAPYVKKAADLKAQYEKELEEWKKKGGSVPAEKEEDEDGDDDEEDEEEDE